MATVGQSACWVLSHVRIPRGGVVLVIVLASCVSCVAPVCGAAVSVCCCVLYLTGNTLDPCFEQACAPRLSNRHACAAAAAAATALTVQSAVGWEQLRDECWPRSTLGGAQGCCVLSVACVVAGCLSGAAAVSAAPFTLCTGAPQSMLACWCIHPFDSSQSMCKRRARSICVVVCGAGCGCRLPVGVVCVCVQLRLV
jgi:hypothetical protein